MRAGWKGFLIVLALGAAGAGGWGWREGWFAGLAPSGGPGGGQAARQERPPPAVVLARAETAEVVRTLEALGTARAAESVVLTAKVAGRIVAIGFEQGASVKKGAVLVRLESQEIEAEIAALEAEAAETRQALERAETLLTRGAGARAPVDDNRRRLQAAEARIAAGRRRLDDTVVRAPFDGRVGLRDLSVGALVAPGTEIATLDTIASMTVRFNIPEQRLGEIQPGARIEARTAAYADETFIGEVRAIGSRVDPALRTIEIEARLANRDGRLRPGMLLDVTVATRTVTDAVVVPPLAVQVRGDEHFVYRVADGKAQRAPIRIGQREPERVQIEEGLKAGDEVVVGGVQAVTEGQPVRVVPPEPPATGSIPSRTGGG